MAFENIHKESLLEEEESDEWRNEPPKEALRRCKEVVGRRAGVYELGDG